MSPQRMQQQDEAHEDDVAHRPIPAAWFDVDEPLFDRSFRASGEAGAANFTADELDGDDEATRLKQSNASSSSSSSTAAAGSTLLTRAQQKELADAEMCKQRKQIMDRYFGRTSAPWDTMPDSLKQRPVGDLTKVLPVELLFIIFRSLDTQSLARCSQVCKSWQRLIDADVCGLRLWQLKQNSTQCDREAKPPCCLTISHSMPRHSAKSVYALSPDRSSALGRDWSAGFAALSTAAPSIPLPSHYESHQPYCIAFDRVTQSLVNERILSSVAPDLEAGTETQVERLRASALSKRTVACIYDTQTRWAAGMLFSVAKRQVSEDTSRPQTPAPIEHRDLFTDDTWAQTSCSRIPYIGSGFNTPEGCASPPALLESSRVTRPYPADDEDVPPPPQVRQNLHLTLAASRSHSSAPSAHPPATATRVAPPPQSAQPSGQTSLQLEMFPVGASLNLDVSVWGELLSVF
ncbi:hypothetical protein CAOG_04314 [Capsaspora owczarzaki ATCC 30864]|uniref:F-box domain-containing protein n=1 Tax=Capsaspora owczarzaki (strain ATCC 30864) TaxID=595528 RepID=A0A0D2VRN0_CAPO3|nr:hypothetical protein CAOG_04314 [Capsaspora owczarzaki ATCC 30864]KJE93542.1 hypothetical protein CAOG_004314 [Capsaspora owczarzaki ATCC 30864]|eukprot:XP_004348142.1 hypothetical protein CAOG_04314 [Capsaspora owczarzaki ATCC 30864]